MPNPDSSFGMNQMMTTIEDQRRNIASFDVEDSQRYTKHTERVPAQSGPLTPEKNGYMSI